MRHYLLKEKDFNTSRWTGGKTKELAIFPRNSRYLDRDFIWRLSSATVETDESDFSRLPDYDRVLMVMEGSVVLTYDGAKTVRLNELEQDSFDGDWRTKSYGRITDFNLMVRKGFDGSLDVIRPDSSAKAYEDTLNTGLKYTTHGLYCKEGYFVANFNDQAVMVSPGELLVLEFMDDEPAYTLMGEGVIIRSQIGYDYDYSKEPTLEASSTSEAASPSSASGNSRAEARIEDSEYRGGGFSEDLGWAFMIANTQFRGAKKIIKKLQTIWYDDVLHDRIKTLEKVYVTFAVYLFGLLVAISIFFRNGVTEGKLLLVLAVWTLLDILVVSPLIYYLALPKPIGAHIKSVDKLTPEEIAIQNERDGRNERVEKIMKRYKNSGRYLGRERDEDVGDE
ncbi:MAG: HutD family protein [Firmicutes bacterium]|nr:HutD family protein [Bacillota bacterium]